METKERYGRFVLQSEDARTSAGSFFRAVQLNASGFERHVQLFRSERLGPDAMQGVAEGLRNGVAVQHAQVVRGFEAGRVERTAFATYEMVEGRSVGALMERSQTEGHPFAADHALLIASKAAAALEAAQAKRQSHGFLVPEFVQVSHDGEVSVRAFGLPPRVLREANCVGLREAGFLAPEVQGSAPLDIRADVFSLGAQLFEMLTGSALLRNQSTSASVLAARIQSPGGDGAPIPKALGALLLQSLAEDPAARFKDATAFKKAVDTLLFSGDYSPTTFNLAFFMHTLFRDEGDEDAARLKAERNADYRAFLVTAMPAAVATAEPRSPAPSPAGLPSGLTHTAAVGSAPPAARPETPAREHARTDTVKADSGRVARPVPPPVHAQHAAPSDDQPLQSIPGEKKPFPVAAVAVGLLVVIAIAFFLLTRSGPSPSAPPVSPTMNAAETAALARVKELESRLAALEAEKTVASQKAADEAKKIVEAQAKARGREVDPAELQKAQEDARRKAQVEQEARLSTERQRIEEERKRAEEARAIEAARAAEGTPAPIAPSPTASAPALAPAASAASTPGAAAGPSGAPVAVPPAAGNAAPPAATGLPSAPAGILDLSDPGVVAPVLVSQPRVEYPPLARTQRLTGTVVVSALVDEQGNVVEARIIKGVAPNLGMNQAALESIKRRKYKPATQNGKPGRAWVAIQIDFKL